VKDLIEAAAANPDCITFDGEITTDGKDPKLFRFGRALNDRTMPWGYERRPNHICAIRTDLARRIPFPEINFGEDARWSAKLRPLLKTEVRVDAVLYYYRWSSKGSLTHPRPTPKPVSPSPAIPTPPRPLGMPRRRVTFKVRA